MNLTRREMMQVSALGIAGTFIPSFDTKEEIHYPDVISSGIPTFDGYFAGGFRTGTFCIFGQFQDGIFFDAGARLLLNKIKTENPNKVKEISLSDDYKLNGLIIKQELEKAQKENKLLICVQEFSKLSKPYSTSSVDEIIFRYGIQTCLMASAFINFTSTYWHHLFGYAFDATIYKNRYGRNNVSTSISNAGYNKGLEKVFILCKNNNDILFKYSTQIKCLGDAFDAGSSIRSKPWAEKNVNVIELYPNGYDVPKAGYLENPPKPAWKWIKENGEWKEYRSDQIV